MEGEWKLGGRRGQFSLMLAKMEIACLNFSEGRARSQNEGLRGLGKRGPEEYFADDI